MDDKDNVTDNTFRIEQYFFHILIKLSHSFSVLGKV